jgi:hypothetical protein
LTWTADLASVLQQYTSAGAAAPAPNVPAHFDQVAQSAPPSVMADGLAAAFKSEQTPGFGRMLATLFANSNADQKAGLLNHLLSSLNPASLTQILSSMTGLGHGKQITAEQAQQISPEVIQRAGENAERLNPSIVGAVSRFYAQHPTLVKTLGSTALAVALAKVAERPR